jgi:hypothetical protein
MEIVVRRDEMGRQFTVSIVAGSSSSPGTPGLNADHHGRSLE